LLVAAEQLFSERGYAATPIRAIADQAGVNPALVHYYFGNKRALLIAVLDRVLEPMADLVASLQDASEVPPEQLTGLLFDMLGDNPALVHLLVREALLPGGELREFFAEHYAPRLGGAFPPLLAREQDAGRLRPDLDPQILTVCIIGLCLFPFIARTTIAHVLGLEFDEPGRNRMLEQINQLLKSGVDT
jgi:AcrR family transcriptional regulator